MTGNHADAEDITQETFVQVFKNLDNFKSKSHLYTWIYRIAKNFALRHIEKKKRTSFTILENMVADVASPVTDEIDENEKSLYISQVKEGCLAGLIRCLSFQQRLVFILHVLLKVPIKNVADIIEKSENATRILIHRSRQNIKDFLCKNCSVYNAGNPCQCENMINFSLKQGWIDVPRKSDKMLIWDKEIKQAESEIGSLKKMIGLYQALPGVNPSEDFSSQLQHMLNEKNDFLIFTAKKVK
jgi:RNA polymerase sigma factor (sigma-70 family)